MQKGEELPEAKNHHHIKIEKMLSDEDYLPPELEYSPVPPVDKDGNRPNSKMSGRLSALREHRRSQYKLSQQSSFGVQSENDRVDINSSKSNKSLKHLSSQHSQKEMR